MLDQIDECVFVQRHFSFPGNHRKNLQIVFLIRTVDLDFKEDTTQGRFVEDLVRVEVGGEDDERIKRHFEFLTRLQRKDILVFFQRNNPAVNEGLWWFFLTTKVVHDEDATGGLQLQWSLICSRCRVIDKVEHRE